MNYDKVIKHIVKKQYKLNDLTFPTWKEDLTTLNWTSTIVHEVTEFSQSYGYKWWKKEVKDIENCKMELTDVLFFYISYLHSINPELVEENIKVLTRQFEDDYNANRVFINFINAVINQDNNIGKYFYQLMRLINTDIEEIFKLYFAKSVLNKFRQYNGYKNGTYVKIINSKEDNVHIVEFSKTIPLDDDFEDTLYKTYEVFYNKAISNKDVEDNSHYSEL